MSIPSRAVHGRPPTRSAALCAAILTTGNQNDGNVPLRPPIDESPGGWLTSCSSGARRADRSLCVPRRRLRQFRFQVSHRTLALGAPLASCRAGSAGSTGHRLSRRGSNTIHLGLLQRCWSRACTSAPDGLTVTGGHCSLPSGGVRPTGCPAGRDRLAAPCGRTDPTGVLVGAAGAAIGASLPQRPRATGSNEPAAAWYGVASHVRWKIGGGRRFLVTMLGGGCNGLVELAARVSGGGRVEQLAA